MNYIVRFDDSIEEDSFSELSPEKVLKIITNDEKEKYTQTQKHETSKTLHKLSELYLETEKLLK